MSLPLFRLVLVCTAPLSPPRPKKGVDQHRESLTGQPSTRLNTSYLFALEITLIYDHPRRFIFAHRSTQPNLPQRIGWGWRSETKVGSLGKWVASGNPAVQTVIGSPQVWRFAWVSRLAYDFPVLIGVVNSLLKSGVAHSESY